MTIIEPRPKKGAVIWLWIKGLACGIASMATCCMCCGCKGQLMAPAVLYDEHDFDGLSELDKQVVNTIQWCGLCGLAYKCLPTCGCCCGCCGVITPKEAVECMASSKTRQVAHM